ncbi:MAG: AzlC family ABC transporter permease [Burkholderiales bacterium]
MRHLVASKHFRDGFAEMLPATIGLIPFGLVCGVGAAAAGFDWLAALGLSAIVFSGAAQILTIQLHAAGAPAAIVVLTCLMLGLRFLMYSAAMAPHLKPLGARFRRTLAYMLADQSFAVAIRRFDEGHDKHEAAVHFLGGGVALWSSWQITNLAGYFAGNLIPASWSLDFAVPLCFIALVAPLLRSLPAIVAALVAGVAVLSLAGLPMRLSLAVAGVLGVVAATALELARERWTAR